MARTMWVQMFETWLTYAGTVGQQALGLALETAPWLLLGLVVAGLLKAYLPDRLLMRWIGGSGLGAIGRAAILGAPLPLCSCGVIPAAIGLRRQGASPGGTISFLVATPETGVDSIAVSYVLLGPFLAVVRPIAAIISAIVSGLACQFVAMRGRPRPGPVGGGAPVIEVAETSCCSQVDDTGAKDGNGDSQKTSCCDAEPASTRRLERLRTGMRYAASDLMDEIWVWMLIGLIAAAVVKTLVGPEATLASWGSGLPAMVLMLLIGVPMYICATASTPLAVTLLVLGMSPGTVLVFLLAGPATNLATVGLVRRELGTAVTATYLGAMGVTTIGLGLATDAVINVWGIDIAAQEGTAGNFVPLWLAWASFVVLILALIRPLRRAVL